MPARSPVPPADRVHRVRLRERIRFPDLSERRALKLSAVLQYCARAHFEAWNKATGGPDFSDPTGVFTPIYSVEVESADVPVRMGEPVVVRGETYLSRVVDAGGATTHLLREGDHRMFAQRGAAAPVLVARARVINVFTRYDADPARRRVVTLPPAMGLGEAPGRIGTLPDIALLLAGQRPPDFADAAEHVWHYGHTDPNRHVNGMEYLRSMESFVVDGLHRAGHDLRTLYFARAHIIYRKPSFRGEAYLRRAWLRGEEPLAVAGAFCKPGDRPAVAVELTLRQHPQTT